MYIVYIGKPVPPVHTPQMTPPHMSALKEIAAAYRWIVIGWPAEPKAGDGATILLARWENKRGELCAEPVSVPTDREGIRQFVITSEGEHEVFVRVPWYGTRAEFELVLFRDMTERVPNALTH